jgi:cephalosporin-C deacetylase
MATAASQIVCIPPTAAVPEPSRCDVGRPADFDAFWRETLAAAERIPLNPTFARNELRCSDEVDVYDVRYDSLDGVRVSAWYCVPRNATGPLPGLILPPGYIQDPPIPKDWAARGYAALFPAPRGKVRSREQFDAGYPGLLTHNIVDRNTYGYRGFYVDTLRAIDVLKGRSEVDAARIGVYGSSQGGALAIVLPALRPDDIVAAAAGVPYLTDYLGAAELTRTYPFHEINDYLQLYPQRRAAVKETLAYFDCLNFAPQVRCPIVVSLGTQDNIVPPETCRAAFDALGSSEKTLYCYGNCGHDGGMSMGFTDLVREFLDQHLRPEAPT